MVFEIVGGKRGDLRYEVGADRRTLVRLEKILKTCLETRNLEYWVRWLRFHQIGGVWVKKG